MDARVMTMIGVASVAAGTLGALPIPTSIAIAAVQRHLVREIARAAGREGEAVVDATPLLAAAVGHAAWTGVMKLAGPSAALGMAAGGVFAVLGTLAVGRAAAARYAQADLGLR